MARQRMSAPPHGGAGGVVRAEAGAASGMVFLWIGEEGLATVKKQGVLKLSPDEAKRLAIELEASATAVWSAERLRRQEIERSSHCGD